MDQQIFTDGVGRITVIGGVVRLDLVSYSPNETDAQGRPRQVFTQRLVMGTDAFLRSAQKIQEIVQQLSESRARPQPAQVHAQAAPQPQPKPPASPVQPQPTPKPASKGEPPYTNGPLFPPKPDKPAPAPFP